MATRACVTCGAEITPLRGYRGGVRKTCGDECRRINSLLRWREAYHRKVERERANLTPEERSEKAARKRDYCVAWRAKQKAERSPETSPKERKPTLTPQERRQKAKDRMKQKYRDDPDYRRKLAERNARPEVREKRLAATRAWQEAHPERFQEHIRNYKTRKRAAELMSLTATLKEKLNVRDQTDEPGR
jgi:hypothetical protein